jgi:hypothetical protein
MIFRRRKGNGATAVVERRPMVEADDFASTGELVAEIDRLMDENRAAPDPERERHILRLRHWAGARLHREAPGGAAHPEPAAAAPSANGSGLPEARMGDVTPAALRAAILTGGALLIRGLMDRDAALRFADGIERSFATRKATDAGAPANDGYYEEFLPDPPFHALDVRPWIVEGGGVLAVDSPRLMFEMLECFHRAGLIRLIDDYLGERALISADKCTLRKAEPHIGGAWHQDGAFLGDVRALNVWLSLSRCGDEAPGLDVVPRRLDGLVKTGTKGTLLDYQVSQAVAERAAGERGIIRPIFEPGDVLLFDELFLHQTGSDPAMPKPRYAVESWFFGASAFPPEYLPLAA